MAQRVEVTCLKPPSWEVAELGCVLQPQACRCPALPPLKGE